MQEVAIIGAGELGGAIAHVLARRDVVRSVRLVDEASQVGAGKALDIAQAGAIEGFATQLVSSKEVATAAGASVLVVADRVGAGEWQSADGLQLVHRLSQIAPRAVILCAGALQREIVDRGVRELRLERRRLFGSAPEALAGGARALVALAVQGSPRDVGLTVLGVPPAHTVIPWEETTVGGFALTRLVDVPSRRRISARIARLWPPGPHALAAAAAAAIDAMCGRSRRTISCFVAPDTSAGVRSRAAAMPVRLDWRGIVEVVAPALSVAERVALENATLL